ncbi:TraV family lipoprotein [Photobacterium toruni]|uniref:Type IV conjugative transfer system lipoprotein (TraV) n=1 Tax=Photobacterium toruni TaxID=1935446 RepID=A0A1T4UST0_9GAMM|nr:TraV family lipoprotein [Photobacterium toruni]SKA55686.1 Type IV conjugative transfer system lipoprotein (TraV) [Photobacterium toruni]
MQNKYRFILVNSILLLTSGCVGVIGEEKSTCPDSQSGVICASSREIYDLTNKYDSAEEYAAATGDPRVITLDQEGNVIEKKTVSTAYTGAKNNAPSVSHDNQMFSAAENAYQTQLLPPPEPLAMRKPANIVRILTRPYTTEEDTLKVPGYAYIEAQSRTWIIDRSVQIDNAQFTSLSMRRDSIKQDYTPQDPNHIGVENRTGADAKLTNMQVQQNARLEAAKLIQDAQSLKGFK